MLIELFGSMICRLIIDSIQGGVIGDLQLAWSWLDSLVELMSYRITLVASFLVVILGSIRKNRGISCSLPSVPCLPSLSLEHRSFRSRVEFTRLNQIYSTADSVCCKVIANF
ncbi:hypothetical protein STSP2_03298 [Anaerohalosphaera lusitana]|uniref:Uncharacterized protein n=1 Tax=Anaerohalosphaera lusitana TaxID=1936003 RepID=A0A1U9NRD8_9BACT|nr:hypothetical protein STSP2_03298 [Anaerohalosphaera lusitana]